MPRIDHVTGCSVQTFPEFINAEAQREGKEPHEIMDEIFGAIEDDNERIRQDFRDNALKYLKEEATMLLAMWTTDTKSNGEVMEYNYFDTKTQQNATIRKVYDAGPRPPQPVKLIEVVDVQHSQTFRSSKAKIVAKCEADDGKIYTFTLSRGDYCGSFYEPPDAESELTWEEVNATNQNAS